MLAFLYSFERLGYGALGQYLFYAHWLSVGFFVVSPHFGIPTLIPCGTNVGYPAWGEYMFCPHYSNTGFLWAAHTPFIGFT